MKPLLHTWSLSVEEQFYIFFPVILLGAHRFTRAKIGTLLAVLIGGSLWLTTWMVVERPSAAFYMLPSRFWELGAGALVAIYAQRLSFERKWQQEVASIAGLLLVAYSLLFFDKQNSHPSLWTLLPVMGAVLILAYAKAGTLVQRILALPVFTGIGLISYSAYLWHQPLLAFVRHGNLAEPGKLLLSATLVVSLAIAYLSWRYVEFPFRNKNLFSQASIFKWSVWCGVFLVVIAAWGQHKDGVPERIKNLPMFEKTQDRLRANQGLDPSCDKKFEDKPKCKNANEPTILVWGDSYAMHLVDGILASDPSTKLMQATVSNCSPILGVSLVNAFHGAKECIASNDSVLAYLRQQKTIRYVVLASTFNMLGNQGVAVDRLGTTTNQPAEMTQNALNKTLDQLVALGIKPVLIAPPPIANRNLGDCLLKATLKSEALEICNFDPSEISVSQHAVYSALEKFHRYPVISLKETICTERQCNSSAEGLFIYRDGRHLSHEGSQYIGKKLNLADRIRADAAY